MSNPEGALATFSYQGAAVVLMCFGKTPVKRETMVMKAELDEKFDALRAPELTQTNVVREGKIEMAEVPDTGPGCERYRITGGSLKLTKAESDHLRGGFDEIMAKDGFPPKWARGVNEVNDTLTRCSATHKSEAPESPQE